MSASCSLDKLRLEHVLRWEVRVYFEQTLSSATDKSPGRDPRSDAPMLRIVIEETGREAAQADMDGSNLGPTSSLMLPVGDPLAVSRLTASPLLSVRILTFVFSSTTVAMAPKSPSTQTLC